MQRAMSNAKAVLAQAINLGVGHSFALWLVTHIRPPF